MSRTVWSIVAALMIIVAASPCSANTPDEVLRQRIETIRETGKLEIGGSRIAAVRLLPVLYERRGFALAWTRPAMIEELMDAIAAAPGHGLDPSDFHFEALSTRLAATFGDLDGETSRADLDLLLTDALARYGFTLHFGKLDPADLDPVWNLSRVLDDEQVLERFQETLATGDIAGNLDAVAPQNSYYTDLRTALADYREIADVGGWPTVPSGSVLKPGERDPRVEVLRARLAITGDLDVLNAADALLYDDSVEAAVGRFQARHGLDPDGKVGPKTLVALNVPVESRIDQLRANLERDRWVFRDLGSEYIIVDIAGFRLHFVRDGQRLWTTRVQVGKPYHATPIFKSDMTYLVFNPTWTIPPGILRNETLPAIRKDPEYLVKNNMSVIRSDGSVVDPTTVDFDGTFRYGIRQEPGPDNALGRVKFMFPNPYFVYLHDTPSKGLFARSSRAFSHGCIRTENPLDLAVLLLADKEGWDRARIDRVIASTETTTVPLDEPMPVLLLYWTAEIRSDGTVEFRDDIYKRDDKIIEGLGQPFDFRPPRSVPQESR